MGRYLHKLRKNRLLRLRFSLAFLLWSLIPHYGFLVHRHPAGQPGHFHQTLSKSDIAKANTVLEALSGEASTHRSEPPLARSVVSAAAGATADETGPALRGDRDLRSADSEGARHAHLWSDANQISAASLYAWKAVPAAPSPLLRDAYRNPDLISVFSRRARGPPAFPVS